jgi:hypothetical protein
MKAREEKIPPTGKIRLTEAVQRLVDLYSELERQPSGGCCSPCQLRILRRPGK